VASEEQADYLPERCKGHNHVWDIGGGLTKLLDAGIWSLGQSRHYEFWGPFDLECDLGNEIKIRLCNSIFAAEGAPEKDVEY